MLKSICVLVLAMSAFAGSLAADTQQQCSDVVPDVNLARDESPKEFEGVTIRGNRATLKPGYRIVLMPGNEVHVESIARKPVRTALSCYCRYEDDGLGSRDRSPSGACRLSVADTFAVCQNNRCNGSCAMRAVSK